MDRKRNHFAVDIISNLPCNLIDDILKYLPLNEAVRTSILSREWRYKWRTTPYLVFDMNFKENVRSHNIGSIVYQVLVQHKGSIVKFIYCVHNDIGRRHTISCLDHWLNFLSIHCIEELSLRFSREISLRMIPHHICDQLRDLHIYHCELRPPLAFNGFDRLVKLDLDDVIFEPGKFMTLMSRFPMLEHLTLKYLHFSVPDFEIDAPNLKSICFTFSGNFPSICLKSTSFLEEVSIAHHSPGNSQGSKSNLIEFFGQLSSVKKLDIDCDYLKLLATVGVPDKIPDNLSHLRCYIDFANIAEVSGALCLIRSSPQLQSLEIKSWTFGDMKPAAQFLKKQRQNCKLTLSCLQNLDISLFKGLEPEMKFLKLILSTAASLVKLNLNPSSDLSFSAGNKPRILEKLARFRRASPDVKIIIKDNAKSRWFSA